MVGVELVECPAVESASEDSEPEEAQGPSVSSAQRVFVQSLSEMVHCNFRLPLSETSAVKYSSLGSLHPPHNFPLHPLLEEMYA